MTTPGSCDLLTRTRWLSAIRDMEHLSSDEKLVAMSLVTRTNDDAISWPSVPRIAADCSMSQNTVRRTTRSLEAKGVIAIEQQERDDGGARSHRYRITLQSDGRSDTGSNTSSDPPSRREAPPSSGEGAPCTADTLPPSSGEGAPLHAVKPNQSILNRSISTDPENPPARGRAEVVDRIWNFERETREAVCGKTPKIRPSKEERRAIVEALERGLSERKIIAIVYVGLRWPWEVDGKPLRSLVHILRHDRIETNYQGARDRLMMPRFTDGRWSVAEALGPRKVGAA